MTTPILRVNDLTMHYTTRGGEVSAVDNVSFELYKGQSLGLVGESGSGKTSIAISLLKLLPDNAKILGGHIYLDGTDLVTLSNEEMRPYRGGRIAMVFQAAMNSLNPVYKVSEQIIEALETHVGIMSPEQARERVTELFRLVGLDPAMMDRYPHEYSGCMRQRAVIAMSLSCKPDVIIADEPTTALDVIVQDSILRQLKELQKQLGTGMLYISHDIAVIAEVCDRIGVMYAGRLAELANGVDIFKRPLHPYTFALMSAFPSTVGPKRSLIALPGEPPDLLHPPSGCRFHPRCPRVKDICLREVPPFQDFGDGHFAACWNPV
ncbi:MAG: ABC transporter ATP-binding protein, partial [Candidatus Roizmanbacteria bacterium]|nr:ABC transporter ATP-binding protein [Candidatus Roizmanbacteria bacterium]